MQGLEVAGQVYRLSAGWPREETYGLTSQARRAAVSISANIAEGVGRGSPKEIIRFTRIALGSVYELPTLLHLGTQLGMSDTKETQSVLLGLERLLKRLNRFIQYQETRL
ncbi:four helix bundle protein [Deinococcus arcticus]|uniref:Four helix bundle protein n=1 Tax=Deinococcus arcticus TaxID=2136176 RepID=A0A2T3W8A6_9DEIO|nr:four helix bundle protein [Deinococcus arcticus]PTA68150.1 four helix bundle protein [Deinococcus arcticus]